MNIIKRELDERSLAFVREVLTGGGLLSKLVLEKIQLPSGHTYTFLPEDIEEARTYEFDRGGILCEESDHEFKLKDPSGIVRIVRPTKSTDDHLIHIIERFLLLSVDNFCVFEDVSIGPKFSFFRNLEETVLVNNDDVYFVLTSKEMSTTSQDNEIIINRYLSRAKSWRLFGILSTQIKSYNPMKFDQLDKKRMEHLVENLSAFFVGAYDNESFILWSNGLPPVL